MLRTKQDSALTFQELEKIQESHCDLETINGVTHCHTHDIFITGDWPLEDCPKGTCEKVDALLEFNRGGKIH